MPFYAQHPALRARQVAADVGVVVWLVLWVLLARTLHRLVLVLAEPGRAVEDLGTSVADSMDSAAGVAEDVPIVGDELAVPLDALSRGGGAVQGAGQTTQDAARWLRWRLGYAREAGAARRLLSGRPDLELLAARALATAPLPRLAELPDGTGAGWRAGDPAAVRTLAALELDRLGLRLPAG
jgi:hypothetical protein